MNIQSLTVGPLQVNCYLVWNDVKEGLVIDPGEESDRIIENVRNSGFQLRGILLTHGHVDHIRAVPELAARFSVPVLLPPEEEELYFDPKNEVFPLLEAAENLPQPKPEQVSQNMEDMHFKIISTPGHTKGGCCYYFPNAAKLFSGDTLFNGSVGRTDLPNGNHHQLLTSIKQNILPLPPETVVYPGHGPSTTIAHEQTTNPFLTST